MIRKPSLLFVLAVMLITPAAANALRCAPLEDSYFLSCASGNCSPEFRAKEITSDSNRIACSRRVVVEPISESALKSLLMFLHKATESTPSGVYRIVVRQQFFPQIPGGMTELDYQLINDASVQVKRLPLQSSEINTLRMQWQSRADSELFWERVSYFSDLGILSLLLFVLYISASRYIRGLRGLFLGTQRAPKLWKPLLFQGGLFLLGATVAGLSTFALHFFTGYLVQVVLIVWLVEGAMYGYLWFVGFTKVRNEAH